VPPKKYNFTVDLKKNVLMFIIKKKIQCDTYKKLGNRTKEKKRIN